MDNLLKKKEKILERLEFDEKIAGKEKTIAEQKRLTKQMKKGEGRDWKKILGVVKGLKPDKEAIQDLYTIGGDLKEMSNPKRLRRL